MTATHLRSTVSANSRESGIAKTSGVQHPPRLGYMPGLDGLRAIAVTAVFLFHAGVVPGGFIGVDVFFVISGFLITALAIGEIERTGRLSLSSFWARRARRLLPALFVVVAAVVVYSIWEGGAALRRVGSDAVATIAYFANWSQIGEGRDYFATYEAEPLLEHAWSLAVEEQFYLVWPLALVGIAMIAHRLGVGVRQVVAAVSVAAAIASFAAAIWLKSKNDTSLSRLYYGTDTRSVGLAVGAFLGAIVRPSRIARIDRPSTVRNVAGVGALVALGWLTLTLDGTEEWLYGPGFFLIATLTGVAMIATLGPGRLTSVLSTKAPVGLGRASYGAYLWQWPVIVILDAERTGLHGIALGSVWVAATAALTALSWWMIEQRAPLPTIRKPKRIAAYLVAAVLISTGATVVADNAIDAKRNAPFSIPDALGAATTTEPTTTPTATTPAGGLADDLPTGSPANRPATTDTSAPPPIAPIVVEAAPTSTLAVALDLIVPVGRDLRLLIVGDSVAHSLRDGTDPTSQRASHDVAGYGTIDVLNVGVIACPIIQDGVWHFNDGTTLPDTAECDGIARFDAEIEAFDPDIVFALFAWPGVGGGQLFSDGTIAGPCDLRYDQAWLADYQAMVDRLADVDRPFIVSTVAPVGVPSTDEHRGTHCLNALVEQITAPVFDFQEWLCPDYDCSVSATLRSDGVHFRNSGQLQRDVMNAVLIQILPISGYPETT